MEGDGDFFTGAEEVPAEGAPEQVCFSGSPAVSSCAMLLPRKVLSPLSTCRCWCELALHVCP